MTIDIDIKTIDGILPQFSRKIINGMYFWTYEYCSDLLNIQESEIYESLSVAVNEWNKFVEEEFE